MRSFNFETVARNNGLIYIQNSSDRITAAVLQMGAGAGSVADFVSLEAAIKHLWIDKTHGEGFGEGWDVPIQMPR